MQQVLLYHGSKKIVTFPEICKTKYTKDFSWGFYCTKSYEQAYKWAGRKNKNGVVNVYSYVEDSSLKILRFDKMTDEWLDFIGKFVNDFLEGNISRKVFWDYAEFKYPTNQISFHSIRALDCLKYERSEQING